MLIQYNKSNCLALGTPDGKEIHSLRPGWNEFPSHIFKQYENHPDIQEFISEKTIVLFTEPKKRGKKTVEEVNYSDEEVHIKSMDEAKATLIVKGTLNKEMLNRWLDEETRHKIKKAIQLQLKKFEAK